VSETPEPSVAERPRNAGVGMAIDLGPALAFVATFLITRNFQLATWVLVGASALALLLAWVVERRIAPMPLIFGLAALLFGTLTLVFHDPRFVKMKMTFIDVTLGVVVLGGLLFNRLPLKMLMGQAIVLPETAWRTLSIRYGLFFLSCGLVNEVVWRTQTDERWAIWRLVAVGAALVFSVFQAPLIMKHMQAAEDAAVPPPPDGF
jgi:intracellular septation protein